MAKELVKITGYRNFHNQLIVDLAKALFDWGSPAYKQCVRQLRLQLLGEAAKVNVPGLIFTYVFARPENAVSVRTYVRTVERHGGKVFFVRLHCSPRELLRRVARGDRRSHDKLTSVSMLRDYLRERNLWAAIPGVRSLEIDTTRRSAIFVAKEIVRHYRLPHA